MQAALVHMEAGVAEEAHWVAQIGQILGCCFVQGNSCQENAECYGADQDEGEKKARCLQGSQSSHWQRCDFLCDHHDMHMWNPGRIVHASCAYYGVHVRYLMNSSLSLSLMSENAIYYVVDAP